jgi:hypothetical protein
MHTSRINSIQTKFRHVLLAKLLISKENYLPHSSKSRSRKHYADLRMQVTPNYRTKTYSKRDGIGIRNGWMAQNKTHMAKTLLYPSISTILRCT